MEKKQNRKCVICGTEIEGWGNNPSPIKNEGLCCDRCNNAIVIPARIAVHTLEKDGGLLIKTNGQFLSYKPKGDKYTLEELQKAVDGYIEFYPHKSQNYDIIIDEDGLLKKKQSNSLAFVLLGILAVGDVLVVKKGLIE
jgi:hypothetical protein